MGAPLHTAGRCATVLRSLGAGRGDAGARRYRSDQGPGSQPARQGEEQQKEDDGDDPHLLLIEGVHGQLNLLLNALRGSFALKLGASLIIACASCQFKG
jgi:hypothetical protein